jgi:hypothetical protein
MSVREPTEEDVGGSDNAIAPASIEAPQIDVPERRSAERRKLALLVHLSFASVEAVFESEALDISRTGVFLCTTEIRPVGTPVRMRVSVDGRQLVLHGAVVRVASPRVAPAGLGIAFDRPVVDDSGLLDELLETKWTRLTTRS